MKRDNIVERVKGHAFGCGVRSLWGARVVLTREFHRTRPRDEADVYRREEDEFGEEEAARRFDARQASRAAEHWVLGAPVWQQIAGLYPGEEMQLSPNERAGRLRRLLRRVERMVRFELRAGGSGRREAREQDFTTEAQRTQSGAETWECKGAGDRETGGRGEGREECERAGFAGEAGSAVRRTFLWNPVREICFYLEIAPRKLSALCREITGMAIQELVDCVLAESLRKTLRSRLKGFVLEWFGRREKRDHEEDGDLAAEIYADLKRSRRDPRWHRTAWAVELGFSSYQRLFRATLLYERRAPHQIEIEEIAGLLAGGTLCVGGQNAVASGVAGVTPTPDPLPHGEGEGARGAGWDMGDPKRE